HSSPVRFSGVGCGSLPVFIVQSDRHRRSRQPDDLRERGDQMKTFLIVVASLALSVSARAQVLPTLNQVWIDNNEATDGVNCGGYCSGVGYAAPAYELSL